MSVLTFAEPHESFLGLSLFDTHLLHLHQHVYCQNAHTNFYFADDILLNTSNADLCRSDKHLTACLSNVECKVLRIFSNLMVGLIVYVFNSSLTVNQVISHSLLEMHE